MRLSIITLCLVSSCLLARTPATAGESLAKPADALSKKAATQEEAVGLAKTEDLPALRSANRVLITVVRPRADRQETPILLPSSTNAFEVTESPMLSGIREALTADGTGPIVTWPPWLLLRWMEDDREIRRMWVSEGGEWGFFRAQGSNWTIGDSPRLEMLLIQTMQPPDAPNRSAVKPEAAGARLAPTSGRR